MRRTSEVEDGFPWKAKTLAWLAVSPDGRIEQLQYVGQKRTALLDAAAGQIRLLIAWPGQYRTDVFEVDNATEAAL
jgi:hypothetical protein